MVELTSGKGQGASHTSSSLKRISTLVALLFTLWPPGPVALEKDISNFSLGICGTRLYRIDGFLSEAELFRGRDSHLSNEGDGLKERNPA